MSDVRSLVRSCSLVSFSFSFSFSVLFVGWFVGSLVSWSVLLLDRSSRNNHTEKGTPVVCFRYWYPNKASDPKDDDEHGQQDHAQIYLLATLLDVQLQHDVL